MKYFVVINSTSGELDDMCPCCSLYSTNSMDQNDISIYPVPDNHCLIEVTPDEFQELRQQTVVVNRLGKDVELDSTLNIKDDDTGVSIKRKFKIHADSLNLVRNERLKIEDRTIHSSTPKGRVSDLESIEAIDIPKSVLEVRASINHKQSIK